MIIKLDTIDSREYEIDQLGEEWYGYCNRYDPHIFYPDLVEFADPAQLAAFRPALQAILPLKERLTKMQLNQMTEKLKLKFWCKMHIKEIIKKVYSKETKYI